MLIIPVKEGENIDRALKRFKRKFDKTGAMKNLRARQAFIKPSIKNRDKIKKAVLEAHKHGVIGGYGGKMSHYMEVKDSDYNVLREVIELLNI